jgi:2-oxoglutarate/2-oxoacid ferredoxin oxidoreductase subunit alpha
VGRRYRPDRGKVLTKEQIEALPKFHRYLDKDGDGIPYARCRACPEGRVLHARLRAQPVRRLHRGLAEYQVVLDRLLRKFKRAKTLVPPPVLEGDRQPRARPRRVGSSRGAVNEALDILRSAASQVDYMRVKASRSVRRSEAFLASTRRCSSSSRTATRSSARC